MDRDKGGVGWGWGIVDTITCLYSIVIYVVTLKDIMQGG